MQDHNIQDIASNARNIFILTDQGLEYTDTLCFDESFVAWLEKRKEDKNIQKAQVKFELDRGNFKSIIVFAEKGAKHLKKATTFEIVELNYQVANSNGNRHNCEGILPDGTVWKFYLMPDPFDTWEAFP